jgi:ParB/RepB/Spo0J family partition protein
MITTIPLSQLRAHPANSNVMPGPLMEKLAEHIAATGHYPPLIVRPAGDDTGAYQVLDGHHRWRVLEQLGHTEAQCVVWDVDDERALVLLATLNRLQGSDDPRKRAALVAELHERFGRSIGELGKLLPDGREEVRRLLDLRQPPPAPAGPPDLEDMPVAVHFFLPGRDRKVLEAALKQIGPTREKALMSLVESHA